MEIKIITQRLTSCDPLIVINSKKNVAQSIINEITNNGNFSEEKVKNMSILDVEKIIDFLNSVKKEIELFEIPK